MLNSLVLWMVSSRALAPSLVFALSISVFSVNISHLSAVLSFMKIISLVGLVFSFTLSAISILSINSSISALSPESDEPFSAWINSFAFSSLQNDFSASSKIWCFLNAFSWGSLHFCRILSARMSACVITSLIDCPLTLVSVFSLFSKSFFLFTPMYFASRLFAIFSGSSSSLYVRNSSSLCCPISLWRHLR